MKKLLFFIFFLSQYNINLTAQNVGIGTNTPTEKLHVEGRFRVTDVSFHGNTANFGTGGSGSGLISWQANTFLMRAGTGNELLLDANNNNSGHFRILTSGDLRLLNYPNTRNNAATTPIENLLYTDLGGNLFSTSLEAIVDSASDHDWYKRGTTSPADDINDAIYTFNRVSIGTTTSSADLNVGGNQIISFIGAAPSSSLISPGNMIINANGGNANITTRAEEFRFNGFDAGTLSTVNIRGIDAGHTALTLGLNAGQTRNVMQITDNANIPVSVFDNEGHLGIGTAAPSYALDIVQAGVSQLRVSGGQNGFNNGEIILQANNNTNQRGLGTFMFDLSGQNEWFLGRPYSGGIGTSDVFVVSRYAGNSAHYSGTSALEDGVGTSTGTDIFLTIRNTGYAGFGVYDPDARLHVTSGGNAANNYTAKFVSSPSTGGSGGIVFTNTEAATATGFKWHTTGTGVGTAADDDLILSSINVNTGATNANNIFTIQGNGNIGLGVLNSANPIQHSSGARLTAAGVWTNASDRRLKSNITSSKYGLHEVLSLRPVDYTIKKNGSLQVGFIAQEVQQIIPEVVNGKEGDIEKGETLGIAYGQLVPVLTKAIQEQQTTINAQAQKIKELEDNNMSKNQSIQKLSSSLNSMDERLQELEDLLKKTSQK